MTTSFDFKNINEFFDELKLLREKAGRAGQLEEDLRASREREQQLEMRVAALSKGATMIPGLSTDPSLDKVGALKELCDQKDAANRKLQETLAAAGYEDEDVQRIREENARLVDESCLQSSRIGTLNAALSVQTEKTRKAGDALALAEKRAADLEAINLGQEYHKARALDLQKRLSETHAERDAALDAIKLGQEYHKVRESELQKKLSETAALSMDCSRESSHLAATRPSSQTQTARRTKRT